MIRHIARRLSHVRHVTQATKGRLYFQSDKVPRSLVRTGLVGTNRDLLGSDGEFFGTDPVGLEVDIASGRGQDHTLDENGFCLLPHAWGHIDYYDNESVITRYYPECEALLRRVTGASRAVAFDHNLRAKQRKEAGDRLRGGSAVQQPLVTYGVHNDYTVTSSEQRIRQLAQSPNQNDTRRSSLVDPAEVEELLKKRWIFVNVWRNISEEPVQRNPLAACDAATCALDDLIVFEIRYADRIGENYFARYSEQQRWFYFPRMEKDEVMLLKCWDSRGAGFHNGPAPATFSLHGSFEDLAPPPDAPDRESIEARGNVALPVLRDADGSFFIDRDGRQFHHILNYLRDGTLPIGLSRVDRLELLREADFYGLKALYSFIGGPTVQAAMMTGGGTGPWLRSLWNELAKAEAADFSVNSHSHRVYARLRYGQEYSGDWIVSSPRNLPHVQYELYDACLARDPITALNKMGAAGFRPCLDPPVVPANNASVQNDEWEIMMYKDVCQ
ncbi:unnamed protein product [Effrenium voratum]|nr:unnamed protein product [Effrenium voratum]